MVITAVTLLIFVTGILVFTAAFGRIWCGWTCPQTVLMEMVFRKIEYLIEGDAPEQRQLGPGAVDRAPSSSRNSPSTPSFLACPLSSATRCSPTSSAPNTCSRSSPTIPRHHLTGLTFMVLFSLCSTEFLRGSANRPARSSAPTDATRPRCMDENTIVVAYDYKRGENRGTLRRDETAEQRKAAGRGDCIDCHQCVVVCPTGIDIRNGTQMECVNCTACIDACDAVMDKIGRPRGLVRFASLNGIERGEPLRFTPRLAAYVSCCSALIGLWSVLVFTRPDVEAVVLRAQGALFQQMPDGRFSNLYTVKVVNKTRQRDAHPIEIGRTGRRFAGDGPGHRGPRRKARRNLPAHRTQPRQHEKRHHAARDWCLFRRRAKSARSNPPSSARATTHSIDFMTKPESSGPSASSSPPLLYLGGVAVCSFLAVTHKSELVNEKYYDQEIKYQSRIDSLDRARQLATHATAAYDDAARRIVVSLPAQHAGKTLGGEIELYRPSAAGQDQHFNLQPDAKGVQIIDAAAFQQGLWKVRVTWNVGARITSSTRSSPSAPPACRRSWRR